MKDFEQNEGQFKKWIIKITSWILLAGILIQISSASQPGISTVNDEVRIARLISLCKLWGFVKVFHPFLAVRTDIDWDAALISKVRDVSDSKTTQEYATALKELLQNVGDPSTRIIQRKVSTIFKSNPEPRNFEYQMTDDAIMVIRTGDSLALSSPTTQANIQAATSAISRAKAVVIDLRSPKPIGDYGKFQISAYLKPIELKISSTKTSTPGERRRVHYGYDGQSIFSSGQYRSGLFTRDGKIITPDPNAKDIPIILVLNEHSGWPQSAPRLQADGKCLVMYKGESDNFPAHNTEDLAMGNDIVARVRVSEAIFEDGRNGDLLPDVVIPICSEHQNNALEAALEFARDFKPSSIAR